MNKYLKTFLGFLVVFLPALLILGLLFNNLSKKSFYPTSGEISVSGIKNPVNINFDNYGIPHIYARNEEDAYFTLGYVHSRDRLWQMDLTRRVAQGRLSEIFGTKTLDFDRLFRTIGIHRFCYNWYNNISPKSKQILDSYSAGVNRFIEDNYRNMPVEFDALDYRPEPWKPEHSLMLARMMGWDLNIAWYTDYILGEIINSAGIEKVSEIFPDTNITIYKKPVPEADEDSTETDDKKQTGMTDHLLKIAELGNGYFRLNESYREFFSINGSHIGSNSWVVSSDKSLSGKPILANDPHLAMQAPSRWYEVNIKGGELDAHGMTLPGVPGIVIGNNRFVAWGLTNLMNDDNDFIILENDSADSRKYVYSNRSYAPDSIKEKIYVKDSMESDYVVRTTVIGPVLSDLKVRGFAYTENKDLKHAQGKLMTFRWTGFENSDDVLSFYRLNISKNWDEFKAALKDFGVPAQNFIYADIYGNIGYHVGGKIPIRRTSDPNNWLFPSDRELEWTGFVNFEDLPNTFNPKEGYIATANTNPFDWLKDGKPRYYISYLWESSSRMNKISSFLSSRSKYDIDDFMLLQNNYESPYARRIAGIASKDLDSNNSNADIKWAAQRFSYWNGEMLPGESIGSVYNVFLTYLIKNTFADELGESVFSDFLIVQNMPYRSLELIIDKNENIWFDNINTPRTETRADIVRQSMEEAIEFLRSRFTNQDINTWHWGELHRVKFRHPLGFVEALDKTFNIGPYSVGGDQTTINNTEYRFEGFLKNKEFDVVVGPSMRMIIDLSDIEHPLMINSSGQSGQPVEDNYSAESRKWLYGEYRKNTMSEMELLAKEHSMLVLIPR